MSNTARQLRALAFRLRTTSMPLADIIPTLQQAADELDAPAKPVESNADMAILHLQAILNSQRTATQAWEAETAARQWLASIGNAAP